MLRGVVVGESIIVKVLERIVAEIPIEFAGCTVVVLPARMASLRQVIEKIEQLLSSVIASLPARSTALPCPSVYVMLSMQPESPHPS